MPGKKFIVHSLEFIVVVVFVLLLTTNYQLSTIYAQTSNCSTSNDINTARAQYLVTAGGSIHSKFDIFSSTNPNSACINGGITTVFDTGLIDPYNILKDKYFTKKGGGPISFNGTISNGTRYNVAGNLNVSSLSGSGSALVFVDSDLTITSNLIYGGTTDNTRGVVFIVGGNVYIAPGVDTIDAFIIAAGTTSTIWTGCSAGPSCPGAGTVSANQLNVNGSLISLATSPSSGAASTIVFNRTVGTNAQAAEKFNFQTKYYVLFKDLLSESSQTWREVAGVVNFPTASPSP